MDDENEHRDRRSDGRSQKAISFAYVLMCQNAYKQGDGCCCDFGEIKFRESNPSANYQHDHAKKSSWEWKEDTTFEKMSLANMWRSAPVG